MVWKKKKQHKYLEKKREVFSLSNKKKYILNRYYLAWKQKFFWIKKDFLKFLKRFKKGKKSMRRFYVIFSKNFFLLNPKRKILSNINFLKNWITALIKILNRDGKKNFIINVVKYIIFKIRNDIKNIKLFFLKIKKNMHIPLKLRVRIIAGRKVNVPVIINEKMEIMLIIRFIFLSLKNRNEKKFKDRLLNELLDVYNNKGFSIKKKIQYIKDLKDSVPNIKYLNF